MIDSKKLAKEWLGIIYDKPGVDSIALLIDAVATEARKKGIDETGDAMKTAFPGLYDFWIDEETQRLKEQKVEH